jgi:RNA polymerase sigma-70 factor (ECF subfamily)
VETILELQNGIRQHRFVSTPSVIEISDDATLARAAREGNRVAFGRLYDRYSRMVHGILLARIPRPEVDDLVQDVFLTALRQIHTLRDSAAFGGWLAIITRNRANDYHRSAQQITELTDDLPGARSPELEAVLVLEKIRSLPEAYRETLILRLVEGMTGPEIAERTGLTAASVRVNLHRGMKQLREKLERRKVHE